MTQLWQIEQDLARRVGPWAQDFGATLFLSLTQVRLPTLTSTLALADNWTGAYLLRRGLMDDGTGTGTLVPAVITIANGFQGSPPTTAPFAVADRVRRIASFTASSGILTVDRPWTQPVGPNELIELHYLDPTAELRVALLAGLGRCFVSDRSALSLASLQAKRDLTALASWITQKTQIQAVQWNYPGSFAPDVDVSWWDVFGSGGHVWLSCSPDPFPNQLVLTTRRPVTSFLGGLVGTVGGAEVDQTTPITVRITAHGLLTGQTVVVSDAVGSATGTWQITRVDADSFTLNGSVGVFILPSTATVTHVAPPFVELDDIPVSLDYGAAAGHVAAWQKFPGRLIGGAKAELFATLKMAADEFSRQAAINYQPRPKDAQFDAPFPSQIGINRV